VPNWPTWDEDLESVSLDHPEQGIRNGEFGNSGLGGTLVLKGKGPFSFVFSDLSKNEYFAYSNAANEMSRCAVVPRIGSGNCLNLPLVMDLHLKWE
jgi:hypothetical protein